MSDSSYPPHKFFIMNKKYLIILSFVFLYGLFGIGKNVNASIITSQTTSGATQTNIINGVSNVLDQYLGTNLSGTIKSVVVSLSTPSTSEVFIRIFCKTDNTYSVDCGSTTQLQSSTNSISNIQQPYNFNINSSFTFDASKYYILSIYGTDIYAYGSNVTSSFPNGICATGNCGSVKEIYFIINSTSSGLDFRKPTNLQTLIDFQDWGLTISNLDINISSNSILEIKYGTASNSLIYKDQQEINLNGIITFPFDVRKSLSLSTGSWYAKANLFVDNKLYFTKSISFTITNINPDIEILFSTPFGEVNDTLDCSVYEFNIFSSSTLGALECYFERSSRDILNWLFFPSNSVENSFKQSLNNYKTVFPFNIFFDFTSTTKNALLEHSVSNTSLTNNLPNGMGSGNFIILSSSSLVNIIGNTNKNNFFDMQKYSYWLFISLIIIKHFI